MKIKELNETLNNSLKFEVDPSFEKFYDENDNLEYRKLYTVDVNKFNSVWAQSELYIGLKGSNQIKNRYQQFGQWLKQSKEPVLASTVAVDTDGSVSFYNGRHRFAWLRDRGLKSMPVAMDRQSAKNAKKYGYIK